MDEFDAQGHGLQWQWQANPQSTWYSLAERASHLRLFAVPKPSQTVSLYLPLFKRPADWILQVWLTEMPAVAGVRL
ncbi:hypothetical protein LJK87_01470 [Paenibacillus sp. P25]|nr:hypothetical protein LJK87_01470 [Paenibacillus sp. P25]